MRKERDKVNKGDTETEETNTRNPHVPTEAYIHRCMNKIETNLYCTSANLYTCLPAPTHTDKILFSLTYNFLNLQ